MISCPTPARRDGSSSSSSTERTTTVVSTADEADELVTVIAKILPFRVVGATMYVNKSSSYFGVPVQM
jgi:hypothetical protein